MSVMVLRAWASRCRFRKYSTPRRVSPPSIHCPGPPIPIGAPGECPSLQTLAPAAAGSVERRTRGRAGIRLRRARRIRPRFWRAILARESGARAWARTASQTKLAMTMAPLIPAVRASARAILRVCLCVCSARARAHADVRALACVRASERAFACGYARARVLACLCVRAFVRRACVRACVRT